MIMKSKKCLLKNWNNSYVQSNKVSWKWDDWTLLKVTKCSMKTCLVLHFANVCMLCKIQIPNYHQMKKKNYMYH